MRATLIRWLEQRLQAQPGALASGLLLVSVLALAMATATLRLAVEAYLAVSLALLLPIMLIAWYLGLAWSLGMTGFVVLSLLAADLVGMTQVPDWVVYVNAIVRASVFALVSLLVAALRQAYRRQRLLATTDALTGLGNRTRLLAAAEAERQRAARFGHPLALAYLDLDGFKQINDDLGHEAGDAVLRLVGEFLRKRLRAIDSAARLGGDEFVLLLPQTGEDAGLSAVSDIHGGIVATLKQHGFEMGLSAGVAIFLHPPDSVAAMLRAADEVMYTAKREHKGALRHVVVPGRADCSPQRTPRPDAGACS
jgi:diguanylate cyclase (GGDEF)-like protein